MLVAIPSFGSDWGFNVATNISGVDAASLKARDPQKTDAEISAKIRGPLRHYDGECHLSMFNLIKTVREGVAAEKRVITEANPVFMY